MISTLHSFLYRPQTYILCVMHSPSVNELLIIMTIIHHPLGPTGILLGCLSLLR